MIPKISAFTAGRSKNKDLALPIKYDLKAGLRGLVSMSLAETLTENLHQ